MSGLLLQTKLFKPTLRPALIARPQLIAQLNASLGKGAQGFARKLTLVCAPAGFGKTTLVSAWLDQLTTLNPQFSGENSAWLFLDEADNDPVRFLAYLTAAWQTLVPGIDQRTIQYLQSPQPPAAEAILTLLMNDINQDNQPVILVLDEYHHITASAVHQALTYLLDHLPPTLHLVIITRSDPPFPISRLRANAELTEVRTDDLRFSAEETAIFLNQYHDLDLSEAGVEALAQRTEGWIAGLHLAALSLQDRDDRFDFISHFTGNSRYIMDYLVDEVLQRRPTGTREFLLQTSILNTLCASLCDAVTSRQDGQSNLERLEEANLFIISLDDARTWYRYHPLFAEVLRARLQRTQPDRVPELYRQAVAWHKSRGMIDEAVRYALADNDFHEAARLIERRAGNMLRKGSSALLMRWLEAMPEETIRTRPRLCLARAWTFQMGPALDLDRAEEWAQLALTAAETLGELEPDIAGEVAALRAMVAATRNDVALSRELSRQALDSLPSDSSWRGVMNFCLGTAHYLSGEMAAATQVLGEALGLSQAEGALYIQLASASFLGEIQLFEGHLNRAMGTFQQVLEWVDPNLPQKGGVMAYGGLAYILCERNQLDAALAHIQVGADQLDQVGGAWAAFVLYRALARVQQAKGHWSEALEALDRAHQVGLRTQISLVAEQAAALRARLYLDQGDLAAAEAWAEGSGLSLHDPAASRPGLREVEYLSLARVLDTQGRHAEAQSLLDRLMGAAQAERKDGSAISILTLQALVGQAQGNRVHAFERLEQALTLAEPEGYIRVFVEEGESLRALLHDYRSQLSTSPGDSSRRLLAYTNKLLAAFPMPGVQAPLSPDPLLDPLSKRELEVLSLVANGASNREIADKLFLAVPTVKKHVSNTLSKLNATSRTQAVAEARDLGLL